MNDKTILGSWCTETNCKFIDSKHIQVELVAHIWYSYDNDSKTAVINKKLCFVNEIDFNELNDIVEILEEPKGIPEKLIPTSLKGIDDLNEKIDVAHIDTISAIGTINEIIDYLESKGE